MTIKKQVPLIITAVMITVITIALNLFINYSSIKNTKENEVYNSTASLVDEYIDVIRGIEDFTIDKVDKKDLHEFQKKYPKILNVKVLLPDTTVKYGLNEDEYSVGEKVEFASEINLTKDSESKFISKEDSYEFIKVLLDNDKKWIGILNISIDKNIVLNDTRNLVDYILDEGRDNKSNIIQILCLAAVAAMAFEIFWRYFKRKGNSFSDSYNKRFVASSERAPYFMFFIILFSQLMTVYVPANLNNFFDNVYIRLIPKNILVALCITAYLAVFIIVMKITKKALTNNSWTKLLKSSLLYIAISFTALYLIDNVFIYIAAFLINITGISIAVTALGFGSGQDNSDNYNRASIMGVVSALLLGTIFTSCLDRNIIYLICLIAIMLIFIAAIIVLRSIKPNHNEPEETFREDILKNKKSILYLFYIILPNCLYTMFIILYIIQYSNTIDSFKISIPMIYLIYGISLVYISPFLQGVLNGIMSAKVLTLILLGLSCAAFIYFALSPSLTTLITAVMMGGLSGDFEQNVQSKYFYNFCDGIDEIAKQKIYSKFKKIFYLISPIVSALVFTIGISNGIGLIGIISLFSMAIFILQFLINKKEEG